MPKIVKEVGSRLFTDNTTLAAIRWNADTRLSDEAVDGIENSNLLLYVNSEHTAPTSLRNVVVSGHASTISLCDNGYDSAFYCPEPFTADYISYTHQYTLETPLNGATAGWETLALPFDVQRVMHETRGEVRPFALLGGNFSGAKPFWLYRLGDEGFVPTGQISANTPYLISMPNNDSYIDDYMLSGNVTFEANGAYVPVTETHVSREGSRVFVPTMAPVEQSDTVYALNDRSYLGNEPGSVFVCELRPVRPFEAYLTDSSVAARAPHISLAEMFDGKNGIPALVSSDELWRVYAYDGVLYISTGVAQTVPVYNAKGVLVRTVELQPGVTAIADLEQGIYLVKHDKVLLKR